MGKTNFVNGNPAQGIMGTIVDAEWLNKVFNHRHTGLDEDGHAPLDFYTDIGAANAYVIPLNNSLPQRIVGMPIYFVAANTNTGPSTLNDGFGTVSIRKNFDQPLSAGDIKAGQIIIVAWDGVNYQLITAASALPSGTSGQTLHYDGTKWVANSVLFNDGTNIGIGTTEPTAKLEVAGDIKLSGTLDGGSSNSIIQTLSNDVIYVNTCKRKLIVVAFGYAVAGAVDIEGYIGPTSPPNMLVTSDTGSSERKNVTFVVPVGWYYKVHLNSGVLVANAWEM